MGKVEIEELGEKSIAEILTLVANPPSLEDKLVEKDMRNLSTAGQDVVKEIYRRKVENVKVQRDAILQDVIKGIFPKRECAKEYEADTYKELLDTLLSPKFLTKNLMEIIDETEHRAKTCGENHGTVCLKESIDNYRKRDNPSWFNLLKRKEVGLKIYKNPKEKDIVYIQTKNKTAERQRSKVVRGIMNSLEEDEKINVSLDDVAAFMLVTNFYYDSTNPYSSPKPGREREIMNIICNRIYNSGRFKIEEESDFDNLYEPDKDGKERKQNLIKMYVKSDTWNGGIPKLNKEYGLINMDGNIVDLKSQNEKVSVHIKDITNSIEDEIGWRSHMLYEHGQDKDKILQNERSQKYLNRLKRFQDGVAELRYKEEVPWD